MTNRYALIMNMADHSEFINSFQKLELAMVAAAEFAFEYAIINCFENDEFTHCLHNSCGKGWIIEL